MEDDGVEHFRDEGRGVMGRGDGEEDEGGGITEEEDGEVVGRG